MEKTEIVKVVICSDSASVLVSLISFHSKSQQDILYEILYSVTRITNQGGQVKFVWVPAHLGVKGNEKVDKVAKKALKKEKVEMQIRISKAEVKCIIWEKVNHKWQEMWDNEWCPVSRRFLSLSLSLYGIFSMKKTIMND